MVLSIHPHAFSSITLHFKVGLVRCLRSHSEELVQNEFEPISSWLRSSMLFEPFPTVDRWGSHPCSCAYPHSPLQGIWFVVLTVVTVVIGNFSLTPTTCYVWFMRTLLAMHHLISPHPFKNSARKEWQAKYLARKII